MRGVYNNEAWVTCVLKEDHLEQALVLCQSMKRVLTSRKLVVITSQEVFYDSRLRKILSMTFDHVYCLDEEELRKVVRNGKGEIRWEDLALLTTFTLHAFNNCVWLSPKMMAMKNADEIFDSAESKDFDFACLPNKDLSVCKVKPSQKMFERIVRVLLEQKNGFRFGDILSAYFKNQSPYKSIGALQDKWKQSVDSSDLRDSSPNELFLVEVGKSTLHGIPGGNFMQRMVWNWRQRIVTEDVNPFLENCADATLTRSLELPMPPSYKKEPVAIVGMSCRYPKCNNLKEFWELLIKAEDGTGNPPQFRWRREHCIRTAPNSDKTNAGFLAVPVDDFDSKFFGVNNKEAVFIDPQQRLLLEVVWEALEDAGVDPQSLQGTNASVFTGSWLNNYKDILDHSGTTEFYRGYMGNSIGAGAARISHLLDITGPSISTESGCSSSIVAVHLAMASLQKRETNLAIVGGVNLLLHPFNKDVMPMVISPEGKCKTFDAKADGFARAEGCGVLVLKKLSDALRDRDPIWGLLRGSGVTQEGVSRSMGTPTVHCESLSMELALEDAGVDPGNVQYVEAHGTGTIVGDPLEVAAIAKAYHSKARKEPLVIGSVKTNVGHTESCSGITGIMKVILSMQHGVIPPHRNFETLNPEINLESVPAMIPLQPVKWKKGGSKRLAGVSSFGITGTDAHVIVEEAPDVILPGLETDLQRPLHILKVSAKSDEAREALLDAYKETVMTSDRLGDICFTLNTGRSNFSQRAVVFGKSKEDLATKIERGAVTRGAAAAVPGKICFLFTGQGSQYPGMGATLYKTSPAFRTHFDVCAKFLLENYQLDIKAVLWDERNKEELSRTVYSQTGIFCLEYALLKLWNSWGLEADFVLGHSLGEFCAAVCAGVLTVEDALRLVAERSLLIEKLSAGKMLVIRADLQKVTRLLQLFSRGNPAKALDIAAVNSKDQTVVAGDSRVVLEFARFLKEGQNLKCLMLEATHAFHSKHMDDILESYGTVAEEVTKKSAEKELRCGFISGTRGTLLERNDFTAQYWRDHCRNPVRFLEASKKAVELECETFLEVGPQPVLSTMTMLNNEDHSLECVPSLRKTESEWETLLGSLGKLYVKGHSVDWNGFDMFYNRQKLRHLPHYPFQGKRFWPDVMSVHGETIHPILGSCIPNASSMKLFQGGVNLRSLEYLKDHVIGSSVIFPGAGYLEMCVAAGLSSIDKSITNLALQGRPLKIQNLMIGAPLGLLETATTQLQTTVEMGSEQDWNSFQIKIFHLQGAERENSKWMSHITASFDPVPSAADLEQGTFPDLEAISNYETSTDEATSIMEVYDQLGSTGLKFGPSFRSLEKVWKSEKDSSLLGKIKVPEDNIGQYLVHPVVVDAMLQGLMMFQMRNPTEGFKINKRLYVPIKIGSFVWHSALSSKDISDVYVYVTEQDNQTTAVLADSKGSRIATMSEVEFVDTTVRVVEAMLQQQKTLLPDLWEEIWKPTMGPAELRAHLELSSEEMLTMNEIITNVPDATANPSQEVVELYDLFHEYIDGIVLSALYTMGWVPVLGETFTLKELSARLRIVDQQMGYLGFMAEALEKQKILEMSDGGEIWTVKSLPKYSREELHTHLTSPIFVDKLIPRLGAAAYFQRLGVKMPEVLRGELPATLVIFPDDLPEDDPTSVTNYYKSLGDTFHMKDFFGDLLKAQFQYFFIKRNLVEGRSTNFVLRVLEVGAGTGGGTVLVLDALESLGINYELTYTDISSAFFAGAKKRFEKYADRMVFKKLNLEEDPISQGFMPQYFDCCFALDVVHATKDICESLRNIRMILKPHGRLILIESNEYAPLTIGAFGLLEGFWRFEDKDLRQKYCTVDPDKWHLALEKCGFQTQTTSTVTRGDHFAVSAFRTPGMLSLDKRKPAASWIIFQHEDQSEFLSKITENLEHADREVTIVGDVRKSKVKRLVRHDNQEDFQRLLKDHENLEGILYCWALDRSLKSQDDILRPFFYLSKLLADRAISGSKRKYPLRLITLSDGFAPFDDVTDFNHFEISTLWGFCKSFENEVPEMKVKNIDVPDRVWDNARAEQIFLDMFNNDPGSQLALVHNKRYVQLRTAAFRRGKNLKLDIEPLKLPQGTDRFQLVLPETRTIRDLTFAPLDPKVLGKDEIEVQVKCSALNFRDILAVLKPIAEFDNWNAIGFDFAGRVKSVGSEVTKWKIGDLVFGMNPERNALPSHVKLCENQVLQVPAHMTLAEAATLPAVFITAYHCLVEVAKLKPTDTVLIHTASGGVGHPAIDLCRHLGVTKIICTAGNKRKRAYLKQKLGIEHVFNSRSTQFSEEILKVTGGRGVDVVLNSLTSEGFKEATLAATAKNGRFVEMSKLSIWTPEEVKSLREDVDYTTVDVSTLSGEHLESIMDKLKTYFAKKDIIKPLPIVRFDAIHIRQALQYLQTAKHIGKVICVMPEFRKDEETGEVEPLAPLFNSRSTYLITGGLGGIGFVVCQWMVKHGAKHIFLCGRSPPKPEVDSKITELNAKGANVNVVQMDVSNFEQCKNLIENLIGGNDNLPPLRGVMHAAGTLADCLITNQEWSNLISTFPAKIDGTWNLHQLTKSKLLEHFILFGSMTTVFGFPGQCNHSAGNTFEDRFVHFRHSNGFPATCISWGPWGQVGVATDIDFQGVPCLTNLEGFAVLEHMLKTPTTHHGAGKIDSFPLLSKRCPKVFQYFDEKVWKSELNSSGGTFGGFGVKSEEFLEQYDAVEAIADKLELVKDVMRTLLRNILKLEATEQLKDDVDIQEMGVDSLMYVEIKNAIQTVFGSRVTVNASVLRECNTVNKLAEKMVQIIEGDEAADVNPPTMEEVNELLAKDCVLPQSIKPFPGVETPKVISTVLLTGATGFLGGYVLRELTKSTQTVKVICLIRRDKQLSGEDKLRNSLEPGGLLQSVDMSKVSVETGNLCLERFGMEDDAWSKLSSEVDAIFHCGGRVDHLEFYKERPSSKEDCRQVNVQGIKTILELAASGGKLKHVFHISSHFSLLASPGMFRPEEDHVYSERWPGSSKEYEGVSARAYHNTKFVQEVLLKQALERGIPCKVLRPGQLTGTCQRGRQIFERSHLNAQYLIQLKKGCMAEIPIPLMLFPVEKCAEVCVRVALSAKCPLAPYNVVHPEPSVNLAFARISEERFNRKLELLPVDQMLKRILGKEGDAKFALFAEIYDESNIDLATKNEVYKAWVMGRKVFRSPNLSRYQPEAFQGLEDSVELLYKDLALAKQQGWWSL